MGLFSFVGRAVKGVAKVVGGVAKVGLGLAGKLGIGGPVVGIANQLLNAKRPMGGTSQKIGVASLPLGVRIMRGNQTQSGASPISSIWGNRAPPAVLRSSPVMPGGAIATPAGIMAPGGGSPPVSYAGRGGSKRRRTRTTKRRRTTTKKRRSGSRKLKFGSPAWRKKYMRKRR